MYIFIIPVCYSAPYNNDNYQWILKIIPRVHVDRM